MRAIGCMGRWNEDATSELVDRRVGQDDRDGLLIFWGDADVFVPEFGVIAHHGVHEGDASWIVGEDDLDAFAGEPIFSAHE